MKYSEAVNSMLYNKSNGYENIQKKNVIFKYNIISEINKCHCSFPTAHVFISFVERKLDKGKEIDFHKTMLEAILFVRNGLGFDPSRYSEEITYLDLAELEKITSIG